MIDLFFCFFGLLANETLVLQLSVKKVFGEKKSSEERRRHNVRPSFIGYSTSTVEAIVSKKTSPDLMRQYEL